jgi:hypothetical protein
MEMPPQARYVPLKPCVAIRFFALVLINRGSAFVVLLHMARQLELELLESHFGPGSTVVP